MNTDGRPARAGLSLLRASSQRLRNSYRVRWGFDSPEARFRSLVDRSAGPGGCWPWLGRCDPRGYGRLDVRLAHRVAYCLANGDPGRAHVLHSCDNPPCCNPVHLRVGTHVDNMADMAARGRAMRGERHNFVRLTDDQVREIRLLAGTMSRRAMGVRFGVHESTIGHVLRGSTWRHVA